MVVNNLTIPNTTGTNYYLSGLHSSISGPLTSAQDNAIVSSIYSADYINQSNTFAGYFLGKGLFTEGIADVKMVSTNSNAESYFMEPNDGRIYLSVDGTQGDGDIYFRKYTGTGYNNYMIVAGNGNVSIATNSALNTTSGYKLHVDGKGHFTEGLNITSPNSNAGTEFFAGDGRIYLTGDKSGGGDGDIYFRFYNGSNYQNKMIMAGNGNVSIADDAALNTTSGYKLHVDGKGHFTEGLKINSPFSNAGSEFYFDDSSPGNAGDGRIYISGDKSVGDGNIVFRHFDGSNYFENMMIAGNGNVVIGRESSSSSGLISSNSAVSNYELSVVGEIRAEEIKVYTGWADYVFEDGYELKSLNDIEQFIEDNGHLPNMPSAEEVQENEGINVGEIMTKQQEKIEELFLYIIYLNDQLKPLLEEKE